MIIPIEILEESIKNKELVSLKTKMFDHKQNWSICHPQTRKEITLYSIVHRVIVSKDGKEILSNNNRGSQYNSKGVSNVKPLEDKYYQLLKEKYNIK